MLYHTKKVISGLGHILESGELFKAIGLFSGVRELSTVSLGHAGDDPRPLRLTRAPSDRSRVTTAEVTNTNPYKSRRNFAPPPALDLQGIPPGHVGCRQSGLCCYGALQF